MLHVLVCHTVPEVITKTLKSGQLGERQEGERMGRVDVWWGDARRLLPGRLGGQRIDFLFLDGLPREYLEYLQARPGHG